MGQRVVITGTGWITPLGDDIESVWQAMLAGKSGAAPTTLFDAATFPTKFSAEVKELDLAKYLGGDAEQHATASRNCSFALAAAQRAWEHSRLLTWTALCPERVGVYLGGGAGAIGTRSGGGASAPRVSVRVE